MTEKIIINGVNVAGCNFRLERDNKQKCECCHATGFGVICDCEAWHNCYYKQLKRLERENKERININKCVYKYQKLSDVYRSALEEIREKIKSLKKDICNNCGWHNTDNCQPNGYVCHDLIEIKNKINEVLNDSEG